MCCSLVCSANRYALLPLLSMETPTILPGRNRLYVSLVAIYAAWGPPYPCGTPNLCVDPTAMSAPIEPGSFSKVNDMGSAEIVTRAPFSCSLSVTLVKSLSVPKVPGYWNIAPKQSS